MYVSVNNTVLNMSNNILWFSPQYHLFIGR
ncbi:hypothetical protein EhV18_00029 [Emiliania huxleyi virus 18]|nr:hypothetical protein EhV18_00029 [Emiliania huxleyi virus 18]